ncbi:integrase catalytic domain-containing protein [Trichonephila clavipes]|uniref:Integrase catalytic domain-containing protein n=1 Tax=Trichonephila clavipes TaxID=2585209 RepID=A0A8X6S1Q3_TRICX|nr:integrase catalytic domain-containing protein [Trichonephila clavipes]
MPFWQHSGASYPDEGKPTNMFSDNATNFKGASSYLKEQLKLIKFVEVQNFVTQESITWHFIPPTAPHIGGLWEAGIKSTKQLLIKTMKSAVLNFEELVTLVTQIEACLNSRPLTPLSNDPQDLQPLTPGHFLIGAPMASFPEEVPSQPACLKKRWNLIQHLRSQFWRRWHLEYLNQLQQRTKWNKPRRNLKVNDMVLVKEDNLPPLQWSLGRVVQVFQETMVLFESWMSRPNEDNSDVLLRSVAYCQLKTELVRRGVCLQLPSTEGATTKTLKKYVSVFCNAIFRRIESVLKSNKDG